MCRSLVLSVSPEYVIVGANLYLFWDQMTIKLVKFNEMEYDAMDWK